ncbi:Thiol-disulfide oxidoreductase resA [Prevotella intermedia]|nr:Thiol-disulfide oxidoreductase resA [Prevotella intermedia]
MFLAAIMAAQVLTGFAQSQDFKPYEEKMNKIYAEFEALDKEYAAMRQKDPKTFTDADKQKVEGIMAKGESLSEQHTALTLEIVKNFKNTKYPAKYIADAYSGFTYDQLKDALDPTSGYYKEEALEPAKEYFATLELRRPGLMYTDLVMKDMNDKEIKLSQYAGKGNYVFVDFWASWCGPCRAEMPNVVEAYNKYHSKGLEIIGVSFDQKKEAWVSMVKKLGMEWPQMSDLKGWQCAAAKIYGIRSIPSNILLDPQGKIVASDLRGEDLQKKLAEIYK